jgi:hypothetical protein
VALDEVFPDRAGDVEAAEPENAGDLSVGRNSAQAASRSPQLKAST